MKTSHFTAFAALTLFALTPGLAKAECPFAALSGQCSATETKSKNIVETAAAAGKFNALIAAAKAAGLAQTLQGDGPFTVFAPTDESLCQAAQGHGG